MKADVQYNDFLGTSAADSNDFEKLNDFIKSRGVDINRFNAIGASFYSGYNEYFHASIICIDKEKSVDGKDYITKISFEDRFTKEDFFGLFKRLNVLLFSNDVDSHSIEVDDTFTIDNK